MLVQKLVGIVAIGALTGVSAFFRMECRGRSAHARIDPIMAPGLVAEHVHSVHGSSGFSESADYSQLRAGNCTSCAVTADKSAYWVPSPYFEHADGTYEAVPEVGGLLVYYLFRDPKNNVKPFPPGFRMIAGTSLRRSFTVGDPAQPDPPQSNWAALGQISQDDLVQRAIGFNCLDYKKNGEAAFFRHFMPDKAYIEANCPDGIRLEVAFPSCWDGKNLDSDDHRSHMAYPDLVQDGNCPDTHPVRLITMLYEKIIDTNAFKGQDGKYAFANGDYSGFGYHGDFMMGWDIDFLTKLITTCTNDSGTLADCPMFSGIIQSEDTQRQCQADLPAQLVAENVVGGASNALKILPGNVKIQIGPNSATVNRGGINPIDQLTSALGGSKTQSSYSAPTLTYQPGTASSYPGGGIFLQSTSAAAETAAFVPTVAAVASPETSTPATTPATTPAPTFVPDPNAKYEAVSTEIRTVDGQVQELVYEEAVVYVTEDVVATVTVSPREEKRRRHWLRHRLQGHR